MPGGICGIDISSSYKTGNSYHSPLLLDALKQLCETPIPFLPAPVLSRSILPEKMKRMHYSSLPSGSFIYLRISDP